MSKEMQALIESRVKAINEDRDILAKAYGPWIDAADAYSQKYSGKALSRHDRHNIAVCLENAVSTGSASTRNLFEATTQDNISFLGIQLPVISALLPSLVLNEIAIVQALDRRQGSVFYLDLQYDQAKGSLAAGGTLASSTTGHGTTTASKRYGTALVYGEAMGTTLTTSYSHTCTYKPIVAGTAVVTDGHETFTDNGLGVMVTSHSGGSNGTIDYTTGVIAVTFYATALIIPTADYEYKYESATNGVPGVRVNLSSSSLTARDFMLSSQYTVGAAMDLEKAHGIVLEDEMIKYLGGEIRFEIDHFGIEAIETAATTAGSATAIGTWTATPQNGQEWLWKKYEFIDQVEKGSNNIFNKTLRAVGNFIITGNDGARVIKQLAPHFVPVKGLGEQTPTGPIKIGTLDGRIVIQDPFITSSRYIMGYRGDNFLMAGFIYAPYIPLFATPTLVTSDLKAQKGFYSSSGFKVTNQGMFTYGTIAGLL